MNLSESFRQVPKALIILAAVIFLLTKFFVLPAYAKFAWARQEVATAEAERLRLQTNLQRLRALPNFHVVLDSRSDTVLALKHLTGKAGVAFNDFRVEKDSVGSFLSFNLDAVNYRSLHGVILVVDGLSRKLPFAVTRYELSNGTIKAQARCYFRDGE